MAETYSKAEELKDDTNYRLVTQKDLNSRSFDPDDNSLPRSKILRGKRNFQRLFEKSTVLNSPSLQLRYRIYSDPAEKCLIGFIAPKRQFKRAVDRNRVKRLLREAYRLNQHTLSSLFQQASFGFHGAFIATEMISSLSEAENRVLPLLDRTKQMLLRVNATPSSTTDIKN